MDDKTIPAFPQPEPIVNEFHPNYGKDRGMTLRDYFAAKALPTAVKLNTQQYNRELGKEWFWDDDEDAAFAASVAYQLADAMMKERQK
jgi:hypothetical protein